MIYDIEILFYDPLGVRGRGFVIEMYAGNNFGTELELWTI